MIEVKNLTKKYGKNIAVDNLSFTVDEGQILGFLGPNGAGKSTTMNMITGYISATTGSVLIDGHDVFEEPEAAKKNIGYLPELPPVYMDMTVCEYLRFVAELKKVSKDERKPHIEDIMEKVRITDMADRLIKHLSKGYRQRVGLAQAIIGDPKVIILDEPTVGLDPKQIIEMRDFIRSLAVKHTVILSSHILSEVSAVCDYILIINQGVLVASDTPENLAIRMTGSDNIELRIKSSRTALEKVIKKMTNVIKYEFINSKEEGTVDVILYGDGKADLREQIFYEMCEAKMPIYRMQSSNVSLEDIFLSVTQGEATLIDEEADASEEVEAKEQTDDSMDVSEITEEKEEA